MLVASISAAGLVLGVGPAGASAAAPTPVANVVRSCAAPAAPGFASCMALMRTDMVQRGRTASAVTPNALPSGFGPADLQSAYALASASSSGGSGVTVGIVDAFDNPNLASDLATYRSTFGLPPANLTKVNENGAASPLPSTDTGWGEEESLDVDMVSAICPKCNILLVEASSATIADLGASVNTAVALGAVAVSNSYGGSESSSETTSDTQFYKHAGVAVTASSGDSGFGVQYPAASQFVTAVGGTSLSRASNARGWSETAWSGAGSGCSAFESKPAFQNNVATNCARRGEADVSAIADPNTGVAVADTFGTGGTFFVFGGTSVASPIIASVFALAGTPAAGSFPNSFPYAHTSSLNDVTSGTNTRRCRSGVLCKAGVGWDGPTGFGTPNGTGAFHA